MSSYPLKTLTDVKNPAYISFLDMVRWIAATIVCVGHVRNPIFFGYKSLVASDKNPLIILWYFVTGWYGEAVIVFFVLSGYLVGGMGLAKLKAKTLNLGHYAIDRVTRLYLAFFPALLLTVILDYFGMKFFGEAGLYSFEQAMFAEKLSGLNFETMATLPNFFGNAFMLQNFLVESYGSNQPLWTISAEFWFYCFFGLTIGLMLVSSRKRKIGILLLLLAITIGLGLSFPYLLGMWCIGIIVSYIDCKKLEKPILSIGLFFAVLLCLRLYSSELLELQLGRFIRDYSVATSFAYMMFSMRSTKFKILILTAKFNKFMASFSFSLYLIHFPVMVFVLSVLYTQYEFSGIKTGYSPVDGEGLLIYGVVLVVTYLIAFLFSRVTEEKTWKVRQYLKSKLPRSQA